jgi:hypothetical protein
MTMEKKVQDMFKQYLLPFSFECCMFPSVKLTLFLSFIVGLKFVVLSQEKNTDWMVCESGLVRRIFGVREW